MDDRLLVSLKFNCGPLMMRHLEDPTVVEIMLNPDGKLWVERYGEAMECVGELPVAQGKTILSLVANALGCTVDERRPLSKAFFPWTGAVSRVFFPDCRPRSLFFPAQEGCAHYPAFGLCEKRRHVPGGDPDSS